MIFQIKSLWFPKSPYKQTVPTESEIWAVHTFFYCNYKRHKIESNCFTDIYKTHKSTSFVLWVFWKSISNNFENKNQTEHSQELLEVQSYLSLCFFFRETHCHFFFESCLNHKPGTGRLSLFLWFSKNKKDWGRAGFSSYERNEIGSASFVFIS